MQVTVTIHEAWLARSEDLRRVMALMAGLEIPPPRGNGNTNGNGHHQAVTEEYPPERYAAPAPAEPDHGDAWEPPAEDLDGEEEDEDQDAPKNGRQLLGWAAKQTPDAKGTIISYGKKHGLASKVVDWTPEQVAAAYRYARSQGAAPATPAPRRDDPAHKPRYSNGELNRMARRRFSR